MAKNSRRSNPKQSKSKSFLTIISLIIIVLLTMYVKFGDEILSIFTPNEDLVQTELPLAPENTPTTTIKPNAENESSKDDYTKSSLKVYFFDVGQADSILLMTDDQVMLVDTGNAGDADTSFKLKDKINLSYELNHLGISKIDYLVLTHPHEDHMGSAYKIIKMFDVKELYANNILPEEEWTNYYKRFVEALEASTTHLVVPTTYSDEELKKKVDEYNKGVTSDEEKIVFNPADYFRVGDTIPFGNAKVTILGPNSAKYSDTNDYSIVLLVEFEDVKLLLTGDAGKIAENEILKYAVSNGVNLDCDVLKVGHHGSRTANTEEFITQVSPEYAVVMVEEGNSYGLPDEDVIERLQNHGSIVYMTQDVGDIELTIDNGKYFFNTGFSHSLKEGK